MPVTNYLDDVIKAVDEVFQNERKILDVISFAESNRFLGLKLFPVQKFILKLFYNLELNDTSRYIEFIDFYSKVKFKLTEVEYLDYLSNQRYDDLKRTNLTILDEFESEPNELELICGRKSGKTFLTSVIATYETYKLIEKDNPQKYYGLAEGDEIRINNIANSKSQAQLLFSAIKARILNSPYFQKYIILEPSSDTIRISTPFDLRVSKEQGMKTSSIIITSLPCTGRGIRGGNCVIVMFDELAHFMDEAKNSSGEEIYETLTPSIAAFGKDGKIIELSTPLNKSGIFYKIYKSSYVIKEVVMVQIPTWEMNPTIPYDFLRSECNKKPESFDCEYGAQFRNTLTKFIKYPEFLDKCIKENRLEAFRGNSKFKYFLALDPSQSRNGYAAALAHKEMCTDENGVTIDKVVIDKIKKWVVGENEFAEAKIIDPAVIEEWIIDLKKYFNIVLVVFDQFDSNYIVQNLNKRGVKAAAYHFTEKFNHIIYTNLRDIIYNEKFEIYNHEEAIVELRQLNERVSNKGYSKVSAPSEYNDDIADAIAHVTYHVSIEIIEGGKIITTMKTSSSSDKIFVPRKTSLLLKKTVASQSKNRGRGRIDLRRRFIR